MYSKQQRFLIADLQNRLVCYDRHRIWGLLKQQVDERLKGPGIAPVAPTSSTVHYRQFETKKAFDGARGGPPDLNDKTRHIIDPSAARWKSESVSTIRPHTPDQWLFQAIQYPERTVNYRVGPWVLEQRPQATQHGPDYYFNIVGNALERREVGGATWSTESMREVLKADYPGLWQRVCESVRSNSENNLVRAMLKGHGGDGLIIPAALATMTGAIFIAEVRRRPTTHPTNLMLLDLIDHGILSWDEMILQQGHPIAYGGGTEAAKANPAAIQEIETDIAMSWLEAATQGGHRPYFESSPEPFGAAPSPADDAIVGQLFRYRLSSFDPANINALAAAAGESPGGGTPDTQAPGGSGA